MKPEVVSHRMNVLTQIIKILYSFVPTQRKHGIREEQSLYLALSDFENGILQSPIPES